MDEKFLVKLAGICALLSVIAQLAIAPFAISVGLAPGGTVDFNDAAMILRANEHRWEMAIASTLATISPALAMPLGLGLYVLLRRAWGYALFGTTMFYVGFTLAFMHEVLRIVVSSSVPATYAAASESTRPAIIAMGITLGQLERTLNLWCFVFSFGFGFLSLAIAALKLRVFPQWLNWALLVAAIGAGWIASPLEYYGLVPIGNAMGPVMLVFFVWLLSMGVILLRWRRPIEA